MMWHDGEYDEYNNYGDDDLPSDWYSQSSDAFDEYEDYVMETGNDPYHVFDDGNSGVCEMFHTPWKRLRRWVRVRKNKLVLFYRKSRNDDIPF